MIGFGRGLSASLYGALFSGFTYFYIYTYLKKFIPAQYTTITGKEMEYGTVCLLSGFFGEFVNLGIKFPFDLIKCRLQSANHIF